MAAAGQFSNNTGLLNPLMSDRGQGQKVGGERTVDAAGYRKDGMKGLIQRANGHWKGQLSVNGKMYNTHTFATKYEAAVAYNSLCMEHDVPLRCNTLESVNALKPKP